MNINGRVVGRGQTEGRKWRKYRWKLGEVREKRRRLLIDKSGVGTKWKVIFLPASVIIICYQLIYTIYTMFWVNMITNKRGIKVDSHITIYLVNGKNL